MVTHPLDPMVSSSEKERAWCNMIDELAENIESELSIEEIMYKKRSFNPAGCIPTGFNYGETLDAMVDAKFTEKVIKAVCILRLFKDVDLAKITDEGVQTKMLKSFMEANRSKVILPRTRSGNRIKIQDIMACFPCLCYQILDKYDAVGIDTFGIEIDRNL